jgi:hypothetical protein
MIRRLVVDDEELLREAWAWDADRPSWYRQMDAAFNRGSVDDLVEQLTDRRKVFMGVFDPSLTAIVVIEQHGDGVYEGHLMARRGANPMLIATVIQSLLTDLCDYGLTQACCWIAERNTSVRKLCSTIGFQPNGVVMWRGSYRGRAIKWVCHSIRREQIITSKAA